MKTETKTKIKIILYKTLARLFNLAWTCFVALYILSCNFIFGIADILFDKSNVSLPAFLYAAFSSILLLYFGYINISKLSFIKPLIGITLFGFFLAINQWVPHIKYIFELDWCVDTGNCPPYIKQGGG